MPERTEMQRSPATTLGDGASKFGLPESCRYSSGSSRMADFTPIPTTSTLLKTSIW